MNALDAIKIFRSEHTIPILLITPQIIETYLLSAYEVGADDCVSKPISPSIFLVKVRSLLKRSRTIPLERLDLLDVGSMHLDPSKRSVILSSGKEVRLSNLEFRLLHLFMKNPGWVFPTEEIISRVWGFDESGSQQLLKHLVYRLRRKIEIDPRSPKYLKNEPGIGYKFNHYENKINESKT